MRELRHALLRLDFGIMPHVPLMQQEHDQPRLNQQRGGNGKTLPAISLYECRLAETNLAAFRQGGLADIPALQLRPIEDWLYAAGNRSDLLGALSVENAQRDRCGIGTDQGRRENESAD